MHVIARLAAVLVAICLGLVAGTSATAAGRGADRVGDFRPKVMKVRLDKINGEDRWRLVTPRTRVWLLDGRGNRASADVDELTRGARIARASVEDGKLRGITLRERVTGSADCSFDSATDDGDNVSDNDSFDCSNDYDDDRVDTDSDCSFDSSRDGGAGDWSMDASWDCSYSEQEADETELDDLDWDCSYSASAGGYRDAWGGDVDADLDFDCSWSGASTDSALWDCKFLPGVLGFRCVSAQLGQEFEYTIDTADMAVEGGVDFQRDITDDDSTTDDGVGCAGNATDGYDCSVDGEAGNGDCGTDWSFDRSRATRSGDVSGSLSYSCSWDNDN